jgi:hypothetical protein
VIKGKAVRVYPNKTWKSKGVKKAAKKDIQVKNTDFYILSKGL